MRRPTFWAALFVVLTLIAGSMAAPDAQAASMHPKIKQRYDALMKDPGYGVIKPGRFQWQMKADRGYWARFDKADILYRADAGVHVIHKETRAKWRALGGTRVVGFPTSDEECPYCVTSETTFTNGEIHRAFTSAYWIHGAILREYRSLSPGQRQRLNLVNSDEQGRPGGMRYTWFENAMIYYHPRHGARTVFGAEATAIRRGIDNPRMGLMTGPERGTAIRGLRRIPFEHGSAWHSGTAESAAATYGAIHSHYMHRVRVLGAPVGDEGWHECGRSQQFRFGRLIWSGARGVKEVRGNIATQLDRRARTLDPGCPWSSEKPQADGTIHQEFELMRVIWRGSDRAIKTLRRTRLSVEDRRAHPYGAYTVMATTPRSTRVWEENLPLPKGRLDVRHRGKVVGSCTLRGELNETCTFTTWEYGAFEIRYVGSSTHLPAAVTVTR